MDRIDDNEQLSPSMGDSTTTTTRTKQINSQIQEVTIERTKTLTYGIEDNTVRAEEFLAYITTLKLQHHIACVQKFIVGSLTMLEVTCQTPYNQDQLREKFFEARITFNGQILKEYSNRDLKALQKIPVIKVMIFEAPFELDNFHIRQKLAYNGKLKDQEVYQHKFKGLDIYNGIRSINFLSLNKPLPTTIYVQGNRIRFYYVIILPFSNEMRAGICRIPQCASSFTGVKTCLHLPVVVYMYVILYMTFGFLVNVVRLFLATVVFLIYGIKRICSIRLFINCYEVTIIANKKFYDIVVIFIRLGQRVGFWSTYQKQQQWLKLP